MKTVAENVITPVITKVATPVHHVEYAHAPVVQYSAPIVKAAYPATYSHYAHAPAVVAAPHTVYSHAAPVAYAHHW